MYSVSSESWCYLRNKSETFFFKREYLTCTVPFVFHHCWISNLDRWIKSVIYSMDDIRMWTVKESKSGARRIKWGEMVKSQTHVQYIQNTIWTYCYTIYLLNSRDSYKEFLFQVSNTYTKLAKFHKLFLLCKHFHILQWRNKQDSTKLTKINPTIKWNTRELQREPSPNPPLPSQPSHLLRLEPHLHHQQSRWLSPTGR